MKTKILSAFASLGILETELFALTILDFNRLDEADLVLLRDAWRKLKSGASREEAFALFRRPPVDDEVPF